MKLARIAAVALALVHLPAAPYELLANAKITALNPRTPGFSITAGPQYQGFFFSTDIVQTGMCGGSAYAFGIPYWDPTDSTNTKESLAYKGYVNTVMLAFAMQKSITVYIDGCIANGVGRVVGLDVGR